MFITYRYLRKQTNRLTKTIYGPTIIEIEIERRLAIGTTRDVVAAAIVDRSCGNERIFNVPFPPPKQFSFKFSLVRRRDDDDRRVYFSLKKKSRKNINCGYFKNVLH